MSTSLQSLYEAHAAASLDKQFRLGDTVGEEDWSLDVPTGELSFGPDLRFPIQILGTESDHDGTWMWAWANPSVDNPDVLTAAMRLKEYGQQHGIPEFTERKIELDEFNGHYLAMIAAGLLQADAYYCGPYDGGAVFMLIHSPELRASEDRSPLHLTTVFSEFVQLFPCDHRAAFLAYVGSKGYTVTEAGESVAAAAATGERLQARFDALGRLTEIGSTTAPTA